MTSAAELWAYRARAEKRAASLFTHLVSGLEAVGAHPRTLALGRRAIHDERRHQHLCEELVRHFGGAPTEPDEAPIAAVDPTRESVLLEVVGMCCINETVSVAALAQMQQNTRNTPVHSTVTEILRDEVQHARLGWSHLAYEATRRDLSGVAGRLQELVDASIAGLEEESEGTEPASFLAAGGLCRDTRASLFTETLERVVLPGLAAHGIPIGPILLPTPRLCARPHVC